MTWKGVRWIAPVGGFCPRHDEPVQKGSVCVLCHREQLAAAARGSSEWEIGGSGPIAFEETAA